MSQELYYTRVATVREMQQFQRNFGPVIAQVLNSAPVEVVTKVSDTELSDNSEDDTPNDGDIIW